MVHHSQDLTFSCVKECKKQFGSDRGLTKHQTSCKIAQRVWQEDLKEVVLYREAARRRKLELEALSLDAAHGVSIVPYTTSQTASLNTVSDSSVQLAPNIDKNANIQLSASSSNLDSLGRGKRIKRRPKQFRNILPISVPQLQHINPVVVDPTEPQICHALAGSQDHSKKRYCTRPDVFGISREYMSKPSYDPDQNLTIEHLTDFISIELNDAQAAAFPESSRDSSAIENNPTSKDWFEPVANATSCRLLNWFWAGSEKKSLADLDVLVRTVLLAEDFNREELLRFNSKQEKDRLDVFIDDCSAESRELLLPSVKAGLGLSDAWKEAKIVISLPDGIKHSGVEAAPQFIAGTLYFRSLVSVIREAFEGTGALRFHYTPFKKYWQAPGQAEKQRVYDELYSSDVWIQAHEHLLSLRDAEEEIEFAIAGLMFWSDATHLTSFGTASVWPVYVFLGNQSKYERTRPTTHACHHLAYIPSVPDTITDTFQNITGKTPSRDVLTLCKHDLMQAVWKNILDAEFLLAFKDGIKILCADGVIRKIFPRIFTYSADYPEKVHLASIRYLATMPCPRCLVPKDKIHKVGMKPHTKWVMKNRRVDSDSRRELITRARHYIFVEGRPIRGVHVKRLLDSLSLTPTENAFSEFLSEFGIDFYSIFVVDLMHEFEIGIWRAIFIHLLRLLTVEGSTALSLLNERFRAIQTFGRDTIRKFCNDVTAMKKLAARDFEDLLQCAIPAFEGLFPDPHNKVVLNLLFSLATWHALAKLRMHTDSTLELFEFSTQLVGKQLRTFKEITCSAYQTQELPSEIRKRGRRRTALASKKGLSTGSKAVKSKATSENSGVDSMAQDEPRLKELNLNTYKVHALGEYAYHIRQFGTTDSYSTQAGELEHRRVKRYYARTNKNNAVRQLTRHERRERLLRRLIDGAPQARTDTDLKGKRKRSSSSKKEIPSSKRFRGSSSDDPSQRYYMSSSRNNQIFLPSWLREHREDPAFKDFYRRLKEHLLRRLLELNWDGDEGEIDAEDLNTVSIDNHILFAHKTVRINHTTYDIRRDRDTINPRTHCDIMVVAHEDDDDPNQAKVPYWFARVLGVYHAFVRHSGPASRTDELQEMCFLWVRWFGDVQSADKMLSGWSAQRLPLIGFVPEDDMSAFGFLDPREVLRAVHLIPAFHYGRTAELLRPSVARPEADHNLDWKFFYVGSFVDRDMFMRFAGGGIGHQNLEISYSYPLKASDLQVEQDEEEEEDMEPSNDFTMTQGDSEPDSDLDSRGEDMDDGDLDEPEHEDVECRDERECDPSSEFGFSSL